MKQNSPEINEYRLKTYNGRSIRSKGNNGIFKVYYRNRYLKCVVADGGYDGWEHVSVSCEFRKGKQWRTRIPTWEEMCFVKDLFWDEDEVVIQLHPAKKDYVNVHPHVLHLWKPIHTEIPMPHVATVGIPGLELEPGNPEHAKIAARLFYDANFL